MLIATGCVFSEGGLGPAVGLSDADPAGPDAAIADGSTDSIDATVAIDAALWDAASPDAAVADASPPDAAPDAGPPCVGDAIGFSPSNIEICDIPAPLGKLDLTAPGTYRLNTTAGTLSSPTGAMIPIATAEVPQQDAPSIRIVSVQSLRVGSLATLSAGGSHALVVVSLDAIEIDGTLKAPGNGTANGAGASHPDACAPGLGHDGVAQSDSDGNSGGSGGGGGGYGEAAGTGAPVDGSNQTATAGGIAHGAGSLVPLRGGCRGGRGGGAGGEGGGGGGAVQLVAKGLVSVAAFTGRLAARGGGGAGVADDGGGGGGGGSGGAVLIEAGSIEINGAVTANGGGGGEGDRNSGFSDNGGNGREANANPAPGGSGFSFGGNGGDGGSLSAAAGDGFVGASNGGNAAGGGGGGGSVGRIRLRAATSVKIGAGAVISPAPAP